MGLYNFQKRFVPDILAGRKRHTIRAERAHPDVPGNTLHLYTGLRQKGAKLLMRVCCTKVENIRISLNGVITVDDIALSNDECEQLARRDGFLGRRSFMAFWKGRLPFEGHIIHWKFEGKQ